MQSRSVQSEEEEESEQALPVQDDKKEEEESDKEEDNPDAELKKRELKRKRKRTPATAATLPVQGEKEKEEDVESEEKESEYKKTGKEEMSDGPGRTGASKKQKLTLPEQVSSEPVDTKCPWSGASTEIQSWWNRLVDKLNSVNTWPDRVERLVSRTPLSVLCFVVY